MRVGSTTWAGGEQSPDLYGRIDLNKYQTGLRTALNFQISVEGGARKRAGTKFVAETKFASGDARLIPWRIADDDSYVLEFGEAYIRFYRFGGQVQSGGSPLEVATPYTAAQVRDIKFTTANDIMYLFHPSHAPRQLKRLGLTIWTLDVTSFSPNVTGPVISSVVYTTGTLGAGETYNDYPEPYSYKVSANFADGSESLPSAVATVNADLGHRKNFVTITWGAVAGAIDYTVYKGKDGIFGFIGFESGLSYEDRNIAPSFETVPVKTFAGFGGNPRTGEFYRQRFVYAATAARPQTVWISRAGRFNELTTSIPSLDDDAIEFTLVGRASLTINHMVEMDNFIIFTDTSEWVLNTNDQALAPATADPQPQSYYGANPQLKPMTIGPRVVFAENLTGVIRDLGYDFSSNRYIADDLSRLARHLFSDKQIVAWDYSLHPYNLMYLVFTDGTLAHMTYVREHEIWGWARSTTQGTFLDVACVSEFTEHATYFIAERATGRFIERVEVPTDDVIENAYFVDCGLTYEDLWLGGAVAVVDDTATVTVVGHTFSLGDVLEVETDGWLRKFTITGIVADELTLEVLYEGRDLVAANSSIVRLCATALSGFDHLEGEILVALADGNVVRNLEVSAGVITLPVAAARVHAGLPYTGVLETLDLDIEQVQGRYPVKGVNDVTMRVRASRGILAGARGSALTEIKSRDFEDYESPNDLLDGIYEVTAYANWGETAAVRVEAPDPLPANVLNIVPDLAYGES